MLTIARYVKQLMNWLGWLVASLSLVVVILQSLLVFNRYLYAQNMYFGKFIRFYDEWLMVGFSALFMLGSAFAFNRDAHVRVDIVYAGLNPRGKHSINFMGVLLFLVPMCAVIFFFSLNSLGREWLTAAQGPNGSDGLPIFWLWKAMVPAFSVLMVAVGLAHLIENFARITQNVRFTNLVFGPLAALLGLALFAGSINWPNMDRLWVEAGSVEGTYFDYFGAGWSPMMAEWVERAKSRWPTPEYRFAIWSSLIWGLRILGALLVVGGLAQFVRSLVLESDPDEEREVLTRMDAEDSGVAVGEA